MNQRIVRLRKSSLLSEPHISPERAVLLTAFYGNHAADRLSVPLRRALAFQHILRNKRICINEGELIVGERGPAPKATPTYPEICCHSISDLETLNSRKKIPYKVDEATERAYRDQIIPHWRGRSMRDGIFRKMSGDWKTAYEAGVFTEFMEQRAPGHTVLDDKIYRKGLTDFKEDVKRSMNRIDAANDSEAHRKVEELKAMEIAADALIEYAERHAEAARERARKESTTERRDELEKIASVCSHVPAHAPRSFWEALQYYWFVHIGVITEVNPWDAFNPGRLDQHLYPFYEKELKEGTLTRERAKELLQALWIKFSNQPAPPKVGVTAEESTTYTDFALINIGGVRADGSDAVNELSYLILDVVDEMRLTQPSSMVQISKRTPDRFLKRALEIVRTGFGQPSIFNTDIIVQEMLRQGKLLKDARNGGASGCVETGAFGKECYILTGYFNMAKILEITLNNGVDPCTNREIGLKTGNAVEFDSFRQLLEAFKEQLNHFINIKIEGNNVIERMYAEDLPVPFLSLLIDDCIMNARDYHDGGARYNTNYIQGVGLGTTSDSLTAIRWNVYDEGSATMQELLDALKDNFEGHERLRQRLLNKTPKYGNDDDYADQTVKEVFEIYFDAVDGRPNTKGGQYRINLLPTTVHIYFGRVVGATPDGRRAGEPLSEGVSPVQGADRKGPTAVIKSVAKIDHAKTGGTLLNQKFTPHLLANEEGLRNLAHLIRAYFKLDGHHVQYNVVSAEVLRDAQKNPEKHRNLIVRVAGYSDYFVDLGVELQNEILRRTEHTSF